EHQVFQDYFNSQLITPTNVNQGLMHHIFEAISRQSPCEMELGERSISVQQFNEKDLQVFGQFAKRYFHSVPLSDVEAEKMIGKIEQAKAYLQPNVRIALDEAERELLLHQQFEPPPSAGTGSDAKRSINERLDRIQEEARKEEKVLDEAKEQQ